MHLIGIKRHTLKQKKEKLKRKEKNQKAKANFGVQSSNTLLLVPIKVKPTKSRKSYSYLTKKLVKTSKAYLCLLMRINVVLLRDKLRITNGIQSYAPMEQKEIILK